MLGMGSRYQNSSKPEFERSARIGFELIRFSEAGCDPNHQREILDGDRNALRYILDGSLTGRRETVGEQESGTNLAARRS
jgi:hypothetical protein